MSVFVEDIQNIIERLQPQFRDVALSEFQKLQHIGVQDLKSLMNILQDKQVEEDLLAIAIWLLARLRNPEAVDALLPLLAHDSEAVRAETSISLAMLQDVRCIEPMIDRFDIEQSSRVRLQIVNGLGSYFLENERVTNRLLKVLCDNLEDSSVRGMASEHLALYMDTAKFTEVVLSVLADQTNNSPELRHWLSFSLGQGGDRSALPMLEKLLMDDSLPEGEKETVSAIARQSIEYINSRWSKYKVAKDS